MKLLLLLIPFLATAQYNFTKAEVDHAFNMCQEYKHNAEEWKRVADFRLDVLEQTKDTVVVLQSKIKQQTLKNDLLTDSFGAMMESYGQMKEQVKQAAKRFGIGPIIGYGIMFAEDVIKHGIIVGVSVQYNLIRF